MAYKGGGSVVVDSLFIVTPLVGVYNCSMVCNHLDGEERTGCFVWFVLLVSRDCCVTLSRGAMSLSAVCDCGIS